MVLQIHIQLPVMLSVLNFTHDLFTRPDTNAYV